MKNVNLRLLIAHAYVLLTLIGLICYFSPDMFFYPIFALGCHTIVYPGLWGFFIPYGDGVCMIAVYVFWVIYILSFVVSYLIAWFRRRYFPLSMIALIDAVFSALTLWAWIMTGGFEHENVPMIVGIVFSLLTFAGLLWADRLRGITNKNA